MDTKTLFKTLDWLPLDEHIRCIQMVQMWKILNKQAPSYLQDNFTTVSTIHKINTRQRSKNQLYVPKYKLEYGKRTFKYVGSTMWNELPEIIRNAESINSFKKLYRSYIKLKVFSKDKFYLDQ